MRSVYHLEKLDLVVHVIGREMGVWSSVVKFHINQTISESTHLLIANSGSDVVYDSH